MGVKNVDPLTGEGVKNCAHNGIIMLTLPFFKLETRGGVQTNAHMGQRPTYAPILDLAMILDSFLYYDILTFRQSLP